MRPAVRRSGSGDASSRPRSERFPVRARTQQGVVGMRFPDRAQAARALPSRPRKAVASAPGSRSSMSSRSNRIVRRTAYRWRARATRCRHIAPRLPTGRQPDPWRTGPRRRCTGVAHKGSASVCAGRTDTKARVQTESSMRHARVACRSPAYASCPLSSPILAALPTGQHEAPQRRRGIVVAQIAHAIDPLSVTDT